MGEKRKPAMVVLLKIPGKKSWGSSKKIELSHASLWGKQPRWRRREEYLSWRYRLRVNGKWWDGWEQKTGSPFVTIYEFRDLLFRTLKGVL